MIKFLFTKTCYFNGGVCELFRYHVEYLCREYFDPIKGWLPADKNQRAFNERDITGTQSVLLMSYVEKYS